MATEFYIPKMTDHMEVAEIIEWLKSEGDHVLEGEPLLELTTDKANVEVPAPASGFLKGIRDGVQAGATVPVGETVAFIVDRLEEEVPMLPPFDAATADDPLPTTAGYETDVPGEPTPDDTAATGSVRAVPAARRLALELGVDLSRIPGTGPSGRVTVADVKALVGGDSKGPTKWLELSPIQRITAERMTVSAQTVPQYSLSVEIDMSAVLEARSSGGGSERPSVTAFLVCAVAAALRDFPDVNGSYEGGRIKLNDEVNVGVAVGTDSGLVVPVVRRADDKSLQDVAAELTALRADADAGRLRLDQMTSGTFTISNLGMYGIDVFTAIVNPPETAILAVGRIRGSSTRQGSIDGPQGRPYVWVTLSVDHRAVDGARGARFLSAIKTALEGSSVGQMVVRS